METGETETASVEMVDRTGGAMRDLNGRGTGAISEMNVETVFSVSDRTDAMTVTMTDEEPELPLGTADLSGNQSERDKVAVTREWWCGERARHAIIGRVAVEAPVYRMTVTDPGWESLTTQDQDFWAVHQALREAGEVVQTGVR